MNTKALSAATYSYDQETFGRITVPVEEPLEIFVNGEPFYVTMRLPGDEIPLAVGLCFTEGVIDSLDDLAGAGYCSDLSLNRVNVYLGQETMKETGAKGFREKRNVTASSCGICGFKMIEDISRTIRRVESNIRIEIEVLSQLLRLVEATQEVYETTGGTHAAGIFDDEGSLLAFAEDVGRHNALDKAIGKVLLARKTNEASIAVLSSRLSYEMVQKAARLGIEVLGGASSATSLAIELADKVNMTLVGYLGRAHGNTYSYTHAERIVAR